MNFDNRASGRVAVAATATRLWPPAPSDRKLAWLPSGQEALLVVGLFGGEATGPCAIANRLVDLPVFPLHMAGQATEDEAEAELLMHVDHEHGVGYIVLSAPSIGAGLLERASSLTEKTSVAEVHAWLSDRSSADRALLVLFHLCHVVLHVSNARCADVRLLRTLRLLATVKQNLHAACTAALKPQASQLPRAGQPPLLPSTPSFGFVFAPRAGSLSKASAAQLQTALELQVRRLLASSKLLSRSASGGPGALYTLAREPTPCVHVDVAPAEPLSHAPASVDECADELFVRFLTMAGAAATPAASGLPAYLSALRLTRPDDLAAGAAGAANGVASNASGASRRGSVTVEGHAAAAAAAASAAAAAALRRFVQRLVEPAGCVHLASNTGLLCASLHAPDVRVKADGRMADGRPAPVLPTASQWAQAVRLLFDKVLSASDVPEADGRHSAHPEARLPSALMLARLTDAESAFSLARGQAALPIALEIYSRALPPQYTRAVHEARLAAAESHVRAFVVGPSREATLARLGRECLGVWQAGRQLCDAISLTGRPCAFRVHLLPHEDAEPLEGLAAASGLLRVGDKLLAINGVAVLGHACATIALKSAVGELRLRVLRTSSSGAASGAGGGSGGSGVGGVSGAGALNTRHGGGGGDAGSSKTEELDVVIHKPRLTSKLGIVLSSTNADSGVPAITALGSSSTTVSAASDARSARPHCSSYNSLHACNCGKTQRQRTDPFDAKEALAFFEASCCAQLPHTKLALCCQTIGEIGEIKPSPPPPPPPPLPPPHVSTASPSAAPSAEAAGVSIARLTLLGAASTYRPVRGMVQDGFLPRLASLTAATVTAANLPVEPLGSTPASRPPGGNAAAAADAKLSKPPSTAPMAADARLSKAPSTAPMLGVSEWLRGAVHARTPLAIPLGSASSQPPSSSQPPLSGVWATLNGKGSAGAGAAAAGARHGASGAAGLSVGLRVSMVEIMVGHEYECSHGHRFLASPAGLAKSGCHAANGSAPLLDDLVSEPMPLCRPCVADGCTDYAQLQRLYVRSADTATLLALQPAIRFASYAQPDAAEPRAAGAVATTAARGGAGAAAETALSGGAVFVASGPLLVPRDSLVCLRLPYFYNAGGGRLLLTKAAAGELATSRDAVLLPGWLRGASSLESVVLGAISQSGGAGASAVASSWAVQKGDGDLG
jgi:hypothetical protein